MNVQPIEIVARRDALGLSQVKLAQWLPWKHTRISEAEQGKRLWPSWATERLKGAEDILDSIAETLLGAGLAQMASGAGAVIIPTYFNDQEFWADWPDLDGLPAGVHRMAAVEAMKSLRDEGVEVRIIDAGASQEKS